MEGATYAYETNLNEFVFVAPNTPFVLNDVQYPSNWTQLASDAEIMQAGLMLVVDPEPPTIPEQFVSDTQLTYEKVNNTVVGRYHQTLHSYPTIRDNLKLSVNSEAYSLMHPTDWYVVRFLETGTPVPDDIAARRIDIRNKTDHIITAIDSATDDELLTINTTIG